MKPRPTRPVIDNRSARNLFLARHALSENPRQKQSSADLLSLIERIGFVQVDSINTVARAHDMILFARNQTYRPGHLKRLLEKDRDLFENWTHDAAIIPTRFFPYWRPRFVRSAEQIKERWANWRRPGFIEMLDDVLTHIEQNGSAMSRDVARESPGWSGHRISGSLRGDRWPAFPSATDIPMRSWRGASPTNRHSTSSRPCRHRVT